MEPAAPTGEWAAEIAKALAHPARIHIIRQFVGTRPLMVHDIVEQCPLAQSTVSEHLRVLREAGVVTATRDGPRTWYCLQRSVLGRFAGAVRALTIEPSAKPIPKA